MSYSIRETSIDSATPVELYWFTYSGQSWYYTNSARSIIYNSRTYSPLPIEHSNINATGDVNKSSLTINTVTNCPVADLFIQQPPSEPVIVTVFGHHLLDSEFAVLWKGRITACNWVDAQHVEFTADSVFTSIMRPGLGRVFQANCPYALYGAQCGVATSSKLDIVTVQLVTGKTVNVAVARSENWFSGGYLTWQNPSNGNIEKCAIQYSSVTGNLLLASNPNGLIAGMEVRVYAGCDHTLNEQHGCSNKFNNHIRFGGTPWQPEKNPFGGSSIY